jgi:molybdenum cofactor cytidylyltransferase
MIFGRVPLADAGGALLAHSVSLPGRVLRKGHLIDTATQAALAAQGVQSVIAARLEPGDTPEGEAAMRIGEQLVSPGLRRSDDIHGRVNLFATQAGLLRIDAERLEALNLIDEAVTLATLPDHSVVEPGTMVATLKIIPFAVAAATMHTVAALIAAGPIVTLRPLRPLTVGLVLTRLPHLKATALRATVKATANRVQRLGGTLLPPVETAHTTAAITPAIRALADQNADIILISGASAVTDRLDVAPQAIIEAGGEVTHFGMPVDPGNLICFGTLAGRPALVLPGCARSEQPNGIDWVLARLFAGEPVGAREIARMGLGGLLKEMKGRPAPRAAAPPGRAIAGLILAAGRSTRMGGRHKLLVPMRDGRPMIAHTAAAAAAAGLAPLIAVTGFEADAVRAALAGLAINVVHAPDYADGLSASLRAGLKALPAEVEAVLVCLGDMPLVEPATLRRLIAAFDPTEGRAIIVPTCQGQRGNPVLWPRALFTALMALTGDTGGRQLLAAHAGLVAEVETVTDSVLRDFDTPESLAALALAGA